MVSQHVDSALVFLDRLTVTGVNQVISLAHAIDELIMARDELQAEAEAKARVQAEMQQEAEQNGKDQNPEG